MTGIFDGMAGVLNGVFGAPVTHYPAAGGSAVLQGVFREDPVEVLADERGTILIEAPTLRLLRDDALSVARGDTIDPGRGKTYRVLNRLTAGSPASDGFWTFELEEVIP